MNCYIVILMKKREPPNITLYSIFAEHYLRYVLFRDLKWLDNEEGYKFIILSSYQLRDVELPKEYEYLTKEDYIFGVLFKRTRSKYLPTGSDIKRAFKESRIIDLRYEKFKKEYLMWLLGYVYGCRCVSSTLREVFNHVLSFEKNIEKLITLNNATREVIIEEMMSIINDLRND